MIAKFILFEIHYVGFVRNFEVLIYCCHSLIEKSKLLFFFQFPLNISIYIDIFIIIIILIQLNILNIFNYESAILYVRYNHLLISVSCIRLLFNSLILEYSLCI